MEVEAEVEVGDVGGGGVEEELRGGRYSMSLSMSRMGVGLPMRDAPSDGRGIGAGTGMYGDRYVDRGRIKGKEYTGTTGADNMSGRGSALSGSLALVLVVSSSALITALSMPSMRPVAAAVVPTLNRDEALNDIDDSGDFDDYDDVSSFESRTSSVSSPLLPPLLSPLPPGIHVAGSSAQGQWMCIWYRYQHRRRQLDINDIGDGGGDVDNDDVDVDVPFPVPTGADSSSSRRVHAAAPDVRAYVNDDDDDDVSSSHDNSLPSHYHQHHQFSATDAAHGHPSTAAHDASAHERVVSQWLSTVTLVHIAVDTPIHHHQLTVLTLIPVQHDHPL
jgi:hypothetical protein